MWISIGASAPYDGPPPQFLRSVQILTTAPCGRSTRPPKSPMIAEIEAAKKDGDTLGGIVEVVVHGLPVGLGSFTSGDNRLDSQLAGAVMGIQAIKGVEIGDGFETARRRGSVAHDEMYPGADGVMRSTNRAGGLEGGMTNGQPVGVRAAMKPISTVPRALATVDMATGDEAVARSISAPTSARCPPRVSSSRPWWRWSWHGRPLEKFGGDSLTETRANIDGYLRAVSQREPSGGQDPGNQPVTAGKGVGLMAPKAVLVGMPGSGKSTIGRQARQGRPTAAPGHGCQDRRDHGPQHRRDCSLGR